MTRNLQPSLLLLWVLVFGVVQLVTMLVALDSARHSADVAMQATLRDGERVLRQVVTDQLVALSDSAATAAQDRALAALSVDAAALDRHPALVPGGFALVVDANGAPMVAGAHAPYPLDADRFADTLRRGAASNRAAFLAVHGGTALLLASRPVANAPDGRRVVTGAEVGARLLQRVAGLSGLNTLLQGAAPDGSARLSATVRKHGVDGPMGDDEAVTRRVALDAVTGHRVSIDMQLPLTVGLRPYRELRLKLIVASVATVMLASLLMTAVAGVWLARRYTAPLQDITAAIGRIEHGTYTTPVQARRRDQVGRLARAVNDMQKEIAEREGRIVHHAQYDALTGLTNRSVVSDKLKLAVSRAQRADTTVAAMAVDLSRFNEINDTMGHEVGDLVLKEVARRLASNTRVSDTVARVGGDEFFVIVEDVDDRLATHMAEFLASALQSPIAVDGHHVHLRAHIGLAMYPAHCETPDALRRLANVALGAAKEHSSDFLIYEPGQDEKHLRELAITHDLPNAIENEEFYLQYQP
ncbi:MAG: GGDEF domain-containing protein, partial [Pseudomonadota bacterium]